MQDRLKVERPKKRLYSIPEAAEYLGLSIWSIRERIWAGHLPYIKPDPIEPDKKGRRILLDIQDLDQWVETHKARMGD